jgi:hypothetical protein
VTTDRPVCDFCCDERSTWVLGCRDLTMLASGPYGVAGGTTLGAWCACDRCLLFVQRADPDGLANRVAASKHIPAQMLKLTTLRFRRDIFRQLYRRLLPKLQPARPLTLETAAAWAAAYAKWQPGDELSARRVAEALEAS